MKTSNDTKPPGRIVGEGGNQPFGLKNRSLNTAHKGVNSTKMDKLPISACIVSLNEEKNIAACLESVRFCREIIVVDSYSTDATVQIARRYTDRVFQHEWEGFRSQKNFAAGKASYEWILSIDSDEYLSPELIDMIKSQFADGAPEKWDGFKFPRRSFFLGKGFSHSGWYPDLKLRLFRKPKGYFGGKEPHDKVVLNGRVKKLKGEMYHYSYKTISEQLASIDRYSAIFAERSRPWRAIDFFKLIFKAPYKFFEVYVLKRGFLDGLPGLIVAVSATYYIYLRYAKLYERSLRERKSR